MFGKLKYFAFLSTLFESCPGQNSCNSVFPRDNSPKPAGFSLHLCPFNLNTTCFGSVNWLCSLWPGYFLFALVGEFISAQPASRACRRYCYLICRCVIFFSFTRQLPQRCMDGWGVEQIPLRTQPPPCLAPDTCGWTLWEGRVKVTCLLRATARA